MKTHSFLNKILVVTFATVLAFVCVARPLQARADSGSMYYIETSDSTAQVVELFSGAELFIPVAIIIIGFIALTYCTLRNVDVPLQFNNSTSFIDKCRTLGQYIIDNATDPIKNFLYSVYTYCQDNNITSITGMAAFVAKNAAQFFVALSKWFNSSFISNVGSTAQGFLDIFNDNFLSSFNSYSYVADFSSVFNSYSGFLYSSTYGVFTQNSGVCIYEFPYLSPSLANNYIIVMSPSGFKLYSVSGDTAIVSNQQLIPVYRFYYASGNNYNKSPSYNYGNAFYFNTISYFNFTSTNSNFGIDYNNFVSALLSSGFTIYMVNQLVDSFNISTLSPFVGDVSITTPASDQVYYPALDWTIDIWNTWDDIADGVNDMTDKMRAFVGDISLTLDSALANTNVIQGGGEYVFPSMDGIWKYPQYFFDTLKGWGLFVGGCLNAVTVGEGGLSWLFYGGFIIIVCGGIIGKILLG